MRCGGEGREEQIAGNVTKAPKVVKLFCHGYGGCILDMECVASLKFTAFVMRWRWFGLGCHFVAF